MLRSAGMGGSGKTGPAGPQGPKGDTGAAGMQGATGPQGASGTAGSAGGIGPAGATGPQGVKGDTGATGPAGSSASATPLGTAAPKALGTAAAGTSANAAHEDHVHPLPSGRWELVGTLDAGETLLLALSLGMKRKTVALAGVATTDKLLAIPNGTPSAGCEVINAYPAATAGQVSIGYYTPALGIAATYSIPVGIYRLT